MTKPRSPERQAELELDRRLAIAALGGRDVSKGPLSLLEEAFRKYEECWRVWNWHSVDPFMGRGGRPRELLRRRDGLVRFRFVISAGRLQETINGRRTMDHDGERPTYAKLIYSFIQHEPREIVRILDLVARWTPERAKAVR